MPKVWTLEQRGISRPSPARSRRRPARPSRRARKPTATGTSRPGLCAGAGGGAGRRSAGGSRRVKLAGSARLAPLPPPRTCLYSLADGPQEAKVAVFGPHPMLSITVESLTADGGDDIHLHSGRAGSLGCADGGRAWRSADPLRLPRRRDGHGAATAAGADADRAAAGRDRRAHTGAYIHDRRGGERRPVAQSAADAALAPRDRRPLLDSPSRRPSTPRCWRSAAPTRARRCRWRSTATWSPTSAPTARRSSSTSLPPARQRP